MKTNKLFFAMVISVLILGGCQSMTDSMTKWSGQGRISTEHSDFNGSTSIKITPAMLTTGEYTNRVKLGAVWNSSAPDSVYLEMAYGSDSTQSTSFISLRSLEVKTDGKYKLFKASGLTDHSRSDFNNVTNAIYTESKNGVIVPLALFKKMMSDPECKLKVTTSSGYEEARFGLERNKHGAPMAKVFMKDFLAQVETMKAGL